MLTALRTRNDGATYRARRATARPSTTGVTLLALAIAVALAPAASATTRSTAAIAESRIQPTQVGEEQLARAAFAGRCPRGTVRVVGPRNSRGEPVYSACLRRTSRPTNASAVDTTYTRAATRVIGKKALAVCWNRADWRTIDAVIRKAGGAGTASALGFVWRGQIVMNFRDDVCGELDVIAYLRKRPLARAPADAVVTLTHEAIHVDGVKNEAKTECFALQLMRFTSTHLGTTMRYGRRLAKILWRGYAGSAVTNPAYYTPNCYDGGPLDLFPKSPVWP